MFLDRDSSTTRHQPSRLTSHRLLDRIRVGEVYDGFVIRRGRVVRRDRLFGGRSRRFLNGDGSRSVNRGVPAIRDDRLPGTCCYRGRNGLRRFRDLGNLFGYVYYRLRTLWLV